MKLGMRNGVYPAKKSLQAKKKGESEKAWFVKTFFYNVKTFCPKKVSTQFTKIGDTTKYEIENKE